MLKWIRKQIPPFLTQHFEHKLALFGLLTAFVMVPYTFLRAVLGLVTTGTLFHLLHKVNVEHNFFDAIQKHQLDNLQYALANHSELLHATDHQGYLPLHRAIIDHDPSNANSTAVFQTLLQRTPASEQLQPGGPNYRTPLHLAHYYDHQQLISTLSNDVANLQEDCFGCTPSKMSKKQNKMLG